jgi:hypothetical protein
MIRLQNSALNQNLEELTKLFPRERQHFQLIFSSGGQSEEVPIEFYQWK